MICTRRQTSTFWHDVFSVLSHARSSAVSEESRSLSRCLRQQSVCSLPTVHTQKAQMQDYGKFTSYTRSRRMCFTLERSAGPPGDQNICVRTYIIICDRPRKKVPKVGKIDLRIWASTALTVRFRFLAHGATSIASVVCTDRLCGQICGKYTVYSNTTRQLLSSALTVGWSNVSVYYSGTFNNCTAWSIEG